MRTLLIRFLIVTLSLIQTFGVAGQESEPLAFVEYEVVSDTANLRAGPSTSAAIAGRAVQGDIVRAYTEQEDEGWYKIQLEDGTDAFIADFLVQRAPERLYPIDQEPIYVAEGDGARIADPVTLPAGLYRLDYSVVGDGDIDILVSPIDGLCVGVTLRTNYGANRVEGSLAIMSRDCEATVEVNGTQGEWRLEIRPTYIRGDKESETLVVVNDEVTFTSTGYQATPATLLEEGTYALEITAQDDSVMIQSIPLEDGCLRDIILYEGEVFVSEVTGSATYRVDRSCTVMWQIVMVDDGNGWTLTIRKL